MKYLSVCSGIEAASKAWEPIGWEPEAFSEIEAFPSAVLKHHWPKVQNLGDMTQHEQWNIPSGTVDLLVGGTPCQSFSVAGLRQGLKDPRGNLMLTYLAIAERLKPRWLVWENVPGVLSSNGGKDFGSFLGALGELGYEWAYRVLDAQWFGVAQRRRRVFVVAHLGEGNLAAKVLFESESVRRDTAPSREARERTATNAEAGVGISPTITQCKGSRGGCSAEAISEITAVHQATAFRMQAFGEYSDDGSASTMKARDYKDATDLVATKKSHWDGSAVHPTLNRGGQGQIGYSNQELFSQGGSGLVGSPIVIDRVAFNQGENAQYKPHIEHSETMDSLVARGPHAVAIPIHDQATRNAGKRGDKQDGKGNGLGIGKPGDPCPTLTKGDKHAVLYENHPNDSRVTGPLDVAPSCVSRYGTGGGNIPLVQEPVAVDTYNHAIQKVAIPIRSTASDVCHTGGVINPADRMAVRRLTPTECERLQGFPDNHTLISWRGKLADQCPDGPRYKALGNSMAVPCMAWIGKRIDAVEKTK